MDYDSVADRLHELERKVLLALKDKDSQTSDSLVKTAGIDESSVNRALLWLSSKALISVKEDVTELYALDVNGKTYVDTGLPEKRFLKLVSGGVSSLDKLRESLSKDEFNVSIGLLKSNKFITVDAGVITLTRDGESFLKKESDDEKLLKLLSSGPVGFNDLSKDLKKVAADLVKRKEVVKTELKTIRTSSLTRDGKSVLKFVKMESLLGQVTPELITNGSWKESSFRKYDLKAPSPRVFRGKKSLASVMMAKFRRIFLDMGFTEMSGPLLESSFWNFDSLYQPQGHPAREMQDTFFIKEPYTSPLPSKELVRRVAKTHEDGWTTGSKGWRYSWSEDVASTNVLRTHTTGVSAMTLSKLTKEDLPSKFFSLGTVFRNETLDYKHLFQFHQLEGIIVDPDASFRDLLGVLKLFFNKLGFEKVRFRPGYFPYTEMSVEPEVLHPVKKTWMELGGAGMMRPEVVKPLLGFEVPVLAWGLSFERPLMDMFGLKDIRDIYSDNIDVLRKLSAFTRRF
ncbi:MAG TPA: phenylalanine--tRNA ligase subunit alpha [Candidatus Nanoarchaeia archaeon]|nr:phenylalanine--tRNA ligase subunit alpha [Candidatus Nanoarchaeia archaeon]